MKRPLITGIMRLYRLLLALYPREHRSEYGGLMEQLFRDQCRQAARHRGSCGLFRLCFNVLKDLIVSAPTEHLHHLIHIMKTNNTDKLSLKLLVVAVLLSAVAAPALVGSGFAPVCLYLATLALLGRAVAEWHRSPDEWLRGLVWMGVMVVVYGLIMPFWLKMHVRHGDAYPSIPVVDAGAVFLNVAIALFRPLISRMGGTTGGRLPS